MSLPSLSSWRLCATVGKSWLFREFAHSKPALLLIANRRAETPQLERFADRLTDLLGLRPALADLPALACPARASDEPVD
jgi:hypothetical protein